MRGNTGLPEISSELGRVEALVRAQRQPSGRPRGMAMDHVEGGATFRMTVGLRQVVLHDQTRAVFHQSMAPVPADFL